VTNQHPITPPPGLVDQWIEQSGGYHPIPVAINAAQWGADQELEACCKWLKDFPHFIGIEEQLRAARRPKPPSLKEQALEALDMHFAAIGEGQCYQAAHKDTIRRALESLPND